MRINTKHFIVIATLGLAIPDSSIFAEEQVYGNQLMTEQERHEHRIKMKNMKTAKERERYRLEHHKKMEKRAKQQGVTLPDMPQQHGKGMNKGYGGGGGGGGR